LPVFDQSARVARNSSKSSFIAPHPPYNGRRRGKRTTNLLRRHIAYAQERYNPVVKGTDTWQLLFEFRTCILLNGQSNPPSSLQTCNEIIGLTLELLGRNFCQRVEFTTPGMLPCAVLWKSDWSSSRNSC
jgi:hypothetical protein